jgi:TldD protein
MLEDTRVIKKVFDIPARFVDITSQRANITNVITKDGVAKDITIGETSGYGVRVLEKVWGFASTNNINDLMDAASRAYKAAKGGDREVPFTPQDGVEDRVSTKAAIKPVDVPLEEKIELGVRAFDSIKGHNGVVSSSFIYIDSVVNGVYMNSEGVKIESESTKVAFFASVFAKKDAVLQVGGERIGATAGFEFLKSPEDVARKAAEKALRLLEAKEAPSGNFKVVLDPQLTGVFVHEALGHGVEADHVLQGDSILEGRIGEDIASEHVTVYDDPTMKDSFGFYSYDSEGTKAGKTMVIQKGMLKSYLHSRETSSALHMENTGNARSQGFDYQPIVRMSNTHLAPGTLTLEEMLEDIDYGVYLLGSKGGEVDTAKGVFQFSAEEGFLIENGKLTSPLKDVALSGETLNILKNVDAVGRDFSMHIGFCGKDGQAVPVGDGGGTIRTYATVGGMK